MVYSPLPVRTDAYQRRDRQVDVELPGDLEQHPRLGFAANTIGFGAMRTIKNTIHAGAPHRQQSLHLLVHPLQIGLAIVPA